MTPELTLLPRLAAARPLLGELVGTPLSLAPLKLKPGRRATLRARGPRGRVVVKLYRSERAPRVAARIRRLAAGPPEPEVPAVLALRAGLGLVVLSHVEGTPLRRRILQRDGDACRRTGAALAAWHAAHMGARPGSLRVHTCDREVSVLARWAVAAPRPIARRVKRAAEGLKGEWACATVVHRDLYEEQILVGERVGLIDLDDAALGPPELDVGNLVAHLGLLSARQGLELDDAAAEILRGYAAAGGDLDGDLLDRCTAFAALRLACIHADPRMLGVAAASSGACDLQGLPDLG